MPRQSLTMSPYNNADERAILTPGRQLGTVAPAPMPGQIKKSISPERPREREHQSLEVCSICGERWTLVELGEGFGE